MGLKPARTTAAIRCGVVPQQRLGQSGAVGDRGHVVGEQRHQPFGAARGGGGEELLDDPAGGGGVDLAAAAALGGDAEPGPVEVLLARGLGDVEDLGDLGVAVGERLAQDVDGPLDRREALHEGQHGQGDRFALLEGVGRAEHRVAVEERFGQPVAGGAFAARLRRAEPVEAQVGDDLGQPRLRHLDPLPVGGLPAQERVLHGVLGVGGRAEQTVRQRGQPVPAGLEPLDGGAVHAGQPKQRPLAPAWSGAVARRRLRFGRPKVGCDAPQRRP